MKKHNTVSKTIFVALLGALLLLAVANTANAGETMRKTLKGAAAGALIGAVVDGSDGAAKGAAIGGGAGLVAGVLDDDDKKRRNRHRDRYDNQGKLNCNKKKNRDKPYCRRR